jgi:hypothetical protein
MKSPSYLRPLLVLCIVATTSCATSQADIAGGEDHQAQSRAVQITRLAKDQFQLDLSQGRST